MIIFAGIAIVASCLFILFDWTFFNNFKKFMSLEVGGIPEIFAYASYDATVNVDFNEVEIRACIFLAFTLHMLLFIQGVLIFGSLFPLVRAINAKLN